MDLKIIVDRLSRYCRNKYALILFNGKESKRTVEGSFYEVKQDGNDIILATQEEVVIFNNVQDCEALDDRGAKKTQLFYDNNKTAAIIHFF